MNLLAAVFLLVGQSLATPPDADSAICSETSTPIPAGAEIVIDDDRDEILAIVGGNTTVYTCDCVEGSGTCTPSMNAQETDVICLGAPGCARCQRNSSTSVRAPVEREFRDLEVGYSTCLDTSEEEDAAFDARVAELELYLDAMGFPGLDYEGDEAVAPRGWLLGDEEVGGRSLAVPVLEEDALQGLNKPRAKCKCTTSGSCHWEGLACVSNGFPNTCDRCGIVLKGKREAGFVESPGNGGNPPEVPGSNGNGSSPVEQRN